MLADETRGGVVVLIEGIARERLIGSIGKQDTIIE